MYDKERAKAKILEGFYAEFPKESTGLTGLPKTETGTQRTRLNAYKHGLTGQIHLFTAEEQTAFAAHCKNICEALAPVIALNQRLNQARDYAKTRVNPASGRQMPAAA